MRIKSLLIMAAVSILTASANAQAPPNQGGNPPKGRAHRAAPAPAPARPEVDAKPQQDSREIVGPVVSSFSAKEVCNIYGYLDGKVTDRSIDGETGVFQVTVSAVNKGFPVPPGSPFTSVCGDPGKAVAPNERFSFEVKAQFRKDSAGWHLERVFPQ